MAVPKSVIFKLGMKWVGVGIQWCQLGAGHNKSENL